MAVFGLGHIGNAGNDITGQRALHIKGGDDDAAAPGLHAGVRQTKFGIQFMPRMGMPASPMLRTVRLIIGDLLIAARPVEHGVNVKAARHIFDGFQTQRRNH